MEEQFIIMFAVVGGAAAIPFLSRRIHMPSAVLEIVYGIILFNTVIHTRPDWLYLMKELGFIYLMFIAGMELDIRELVGGKRFCWYLLISALSFGVMPFIFYRMGYPFFIGVAVSVLSAGIIIPVLRELELMQTPLGRDIIGTALTGELISIIVLTVLDIYHQHGVTYMAAWAGVKLLLLMFGAAFFLKLIYVLAWWFPERVEKVMESEDPVEEGVRAVITVAFAGAIIAYASGVEAILGSFIAGFIFSYVFRNKGRFEEKINAVGFGFFIPFFFIGVGAGFDIGLLSSTGSILFSFFLTAMLLVGNGFPLLFRAFMGINAIEALGMSLILSAPLSLLVVAAALGERMGLIDNEMKGVLILTAIVSGIVYPFMFRLVGKRIAVQVPDK